MPHNPGKPHLQTITQDELCAAIFAEYSDPHPPAEIGRVKNRAKHLHDDLTHKTLGVRSQYDPTDLNAVKWGVIFHPDTEQQVKDALQPLIAVRPGIPDRKMLEYTPGESASQFRLRYGHPPFGAVDPAILPYYLLIIGPPTQIPFEFQYDLDAQHAVGRLHFDDPAAYAAYVASVLTYEGADATQRTPTVAMFSPHGDVLAQQAANFLVTPLANMVTGNALMCQPNPPTYTVEHANAAAATRASLAAAIHRTNNPPSLLFTSSHGLEVPKNHPDQNLDQGALVCQPSPDVQYFSGRDIGDDWDLTGLLTFSFACFSAGTPKNQTFTEYFGYSPAQQADQDFIAYLPQRMLAQGALAFIGHVDQAWSYSYGWPGSSAMTATFEDVLCEILCGHPIGSAMEHFNVKYLDANNALTSDLIPRYRDDEPVDQMMTDTWIARNDARTYIILGDPAVRLRPGIFAPRV